VTEHITVYKGILRTGPVDAPLTGGPGSYLTWTADRPHVYAAVGDDEVHASLVIRTPAAG
jgi:hypothetical protein